MSATQWRHLKLAYSGKVVTGRSPTMSSAKFNRVFPRRRSSIPRTRAFRSQLIKDESGPPLADLGKAIERKNYADFARAFTKLTEACNRCHRDAKAGFIVIRIPTSSPFSNQLFLPAQQ